MKIEELVGYQLIACAFSKSSYIFYFVGYQHVENRERQHVEFYLTTHYHVSVSSDKREDVGKAFSKELWSYLEGFIKSVAVNIDKEHSSVTLTFENDNDVVIFAYDAIGDKLFNISKVDTGRLYYIK